VSRQRLSKWVHRYRDGGDHALLDRSSAPRHRPTRTPQPTIDRIIDLRKRHRWSARTIASHLTDEGTPVSTATVTRHRKANGLNRLRHLDPSQANRTANPDQARSPPTPDVPI
jgi:transposase